MVSKKIPIMIMCHGRSTLRVATEFGWLPGARYTNLRDIREFKNVGLIDIEWKNYIFLRHLEAVRRVKPHITIAQDVVDASDLDKILEQAKELNRWSNKVVIVPKDIKLGSNLADIVPDEYLLGYSVPTIYGSTSIPLKSFRNRPVHLLGGRPDVQFKLASQLNVYSLDGNRITLDARYGDYFAGTCFRPHPTGGYYECIRASLQKIGDLWGDEWSNQLKLGQATQKDLLPIKKLADSHKIQLGFVLKPAIEESIKARWILTAKIKRKLVGYIRFRHRRDSITKIYEICVDPSYRLRNTGRRLIESLRQKAEKLNHREIVLKCPEDLSANKFYKRLSFKNCGLERGKKRRLRLWKYELKP